MKTKPSKGNQKRKITKPQELVDLSQELLELLRDCLDEYSYAYSLAWDTWSEAHVESVYAKSSDLTDTTAQAALDARNERLRGALRHSDKMIRSAHASVLTAWRSLSRAFPHQDELPYTPDEAYDRFNSIPLLPEDEMQELLEAQKRRKERGER